MIKGGVGDYVKLQHKGKMKKEIIRIAAAIICAVVLITGSTAMNVKAEGNEYYISDDKNNIIAKSGDWISRGTTIRSVQGGGQVPTKIYVDNALQSGDGKPLNLYIDDYTVPADTPDSRGLCVDKISQDIVNIPGYDAFKIYIVYLVSTDPSAAVSTSNTATASHVHNYEWVTVREATATEDGEMDYMCSCGDVKERQIIPKYVGATKEVNDALDAAKSGQTITLDTGDNCSFNRDTMDKIANDTQNNIKVVIKYIYKGVHYIMTIPAGSNPAAIRSLNFTAACIHAC